MAAGHNNGFNPFRDASGRFSGKGRMDAGVSAAASKGSGAMNDALRSASGRATGGSSGGGDPTDRAAVGGILASVTPTAQGGVKGAGMYPIENQDDRSESVIGRYESPQASPDKGRAFTAPEDVSGELDTRGFGEVWGKSAQEMLSGSPMDVREALSSAAVDFDGDGSLRKRYYDANGLTPTNPTLQEFNDLVATRYKGETAQNEDTRFIRMAAYAQALGERDFSTDLLDRTSFGAELGAVGLTEQIGVPIAK